MAPQSPPLVHQPVLLSDVVNFLRASSGGTFVDCTVGLGGHTEAILKASPESVVVGIDRDAESLDRAGSRLARFGDRFKPYRSNFKELDQALRHYGIVEIQGCLADLGVSSVQLDSPERGFSFAHDAGLDMRMDRSAGQTAADLVRDLQEEELANIIFQYGEERGARKIARAIVKERQKTPILSTAQLAAIVVKAMHIPGRWKIHPATRTFMALRIAVNKELERLEEFISLAITYLRKEGRLAIISFHSLEDRIVKTRFRLESGRCICDSRTAGRLARYKSEPSWLMSTNPAEGRSQRSSSEATACTGCGARKRISILTTKPIQPGAEELAANPRARSAKLRVAEKLASSVESPEFSSSGQKRL